MREKISPVNPRPTASGFMIANVRSIAIQILSGKSICSGLLASCFLDSLLLNDRRQRGSNVGRALNCMNACRGHGFVFLDGGARSAADDRAGMAHAAARR